jgi:DNA-binding response OmpR family regulator
MNSPEVKKSNSLVVVEDDVYMQNLLSHYLEEEYDVKVFDNGLDAYAYLQEGNIPDIIIADLNIPKLSGLDLILQVKASGFFSSIPIMVLSGEESTEKRIKCLEAGADDYVVKPFNPRELEARIKVLLRRTGKLQS